jgi:hypothetical protein
LIESDSLVGTKCANALSGTGVCKAVLLELLEPPPPPPPPDVLPVVVDRDVPPTEVVALDEVAVLVLVAARTDDVVPVVDAFDSAALGLTVDAAEVVVVFPEASAEVAADADETPFGAELVSSEVLAPPPPDPAPADDPCVFDAVAATVPDVVACT